MRTLFMVFALGGAAAWVITLQRRLQSAQMRGDMYRDIAVRRDRQLVDQTGREQ